MGQRPRRLYQMLRPFFGGFGTTSKNVYGESITRHLSVAYGLSSSGCPSLDPIPPGPGLSFSRLRFYHDHVRAAHSSSSREEEKIRSQMMRGNDGESFHRVFPDLVQDITDSLYTPGAEDVITRFKQVCEYNVPHGKLNRGLMVVESYARLADSPLVSADHFRHDSMIHKARILGWCVEWLQACLLVLDDVMDGSSMRRGRAAWHAKPDVGIVAVNDGLFLENCIFLLLEKHFSNLPSYVPLVNLFRTILMKTVCGQSFDMLSARGGGREASFLDFSRQRYATICINKTALYTFHLPIIAALRLAQISDPTLERHLSSILENLGILFQSQDDFLDCFGDAVTTGKIGTDIEEGKCTWLIVEALYVAGEEQRATLTRCYGNDDPIYVDAVKRMYRQLNLPALFADYEEKARAELLESIVALEPTGFPITILYDGLDKLEKRRK